MHYKGKGESEIMSFNKLIVMGNLTRDPELRYTAKGTPVCTLNIANNERERDPKTGELAERVTYFKATAWGKQAETIAAHFARGSEIYLEGKFKPEEWTDRDGKSRVTFGIQIREFNFTGGSNRSDKSASDSASPMRMTGDSAGDNSGILDDDIPF
jgi:single-strand DNA-binding protein